MVILESDSKKAIDILNNRILHFVVSNWTREINWWTHKFEEIRFDGPSKREANKVADRFATRRPPGFFFSFLFITFFEQST